MERVFSINEQLQMENLHEESLISQRIIHDRTIFVGGIMKVVITKEFLASAGAARQKYMPYLEELRAPRLREGNKKRKEKI